MNEIFRNFAVLFFVTGMMVFTSCAKKNQNETVTAEGTASSQNPVYAAASSSGSGNEKTVGKELSVQDPWAGIFRKAGLPDSLAEKILSHLQEGPDFTMELLFLMEMDPYLYRLVDKQHSLDSGYVPDDLEDLENGSYRVTRQGLTLRRAAANSLKTMAVAALRDGVTLTAASAFRTYAYQADVYSRNVREMGQQAADRESARPGHSQHQLGLVVDFNPIDDTFAETAAGRWLTQNAARYGWSLSFPQGYEEVTGYRWESWHYRYLGPLLADFTEKYFDGIQQYALMFIDAWRDASG